MLTDKIRSDHEAFDAVRESIRSRVIESAIPSLALAVAQHGEILWEEAFGWADRENRVPGIKVHCQFYITYQLIGIVNNLHSPAAEHIAGAYQHRITNKFGHIEGFINGSNAGSWWLWYT